MSSIEDKTTAARSTTAEAHAAERRADRLRALEEERVGYERRDLPERAQQVQQQIDQLRQGSPEGRSVDADAVVTATSDPGADPDTAADRSEPALSAGTNPAEQRADAADEKPKSRRAPRGSTVTG